MIADKIKSLFEGINRKHREQNTIYVTDLTSCMRRAFFNIYFNASPKPKGSMIAGTLFHYALREILKGDEFSNAVFEVECSYEIGSWRIKGRADVVTDDAIYEFKFTRGTKFNKASPLYFAQVSAYCKMLEKDKGYLVLVDRDNFDVEVLEVTECDELWDIMLSDARILIDHINNPRIPYYKSPCFDWECRNCVWNIVCYNLRGDADGAKLV